MATHTITRHKAMTYIHTGIGCVARFLHTFIYRTEHIPSIDDFNLHTNNRIYIVNILITAR